MNIDFDFEINILNNFFLYRLEFVNSKKKKFSNNIELI